jgi:hypothetical protein
MRIADLLIAIILAGVGLSGAYLRAELVLQRRMTAVQRGGELAQLELHTKRVRPGQKDASAAAPDTFVDSNKEFSDGEGFALRLTHLHRRTLYSSVLNSCVSVRGQESAMAVRRTPLTRPMRLKTTGVSDAQ